MAEETTIQDFSPDQLRRIAGMAKFQAEEQMRAVRYEGAARSFEIAALACQLHGDPKPSVAGDQDA